MAGAYEREALRPHALGQFATSCAQPTAIR
jgi:uncharacterized protein (DUF1800 family)